MFKDGLYPNVPIVSFSVMIKNNIIQMLLIKHKNGTFWSQGIKF